MGQISSIKNQGKQQYYDVDMSLLTTPPAPAKIVLNPYDRGEAFGKVLHPNIVKPQSVLIAISPDGLLCQCRDYKQWYGCRCNFGINKGTTHVTHTYISIILFIQGNITMRLLLLMRVYAVWDGPHKQLHWN